MKNKFGNRYTRAIATFHFHKFVQRFRRTFSLTLSFILLFACFPADARESKKTLQENGNTTAFLTELCNGRHGSATEQNHHLKRLGSEILIGENNFRYFAGRKT